MSSTMARIGAVSAVFAALLIALQQINEPIEHTFPRMGFSCVHHPAIGSLGQVATMFSIVGAMCWFAVRVAELGSEIEAGDQSHSDPAPVVLGVIIGAFMLYAIGLMVFAVVTWRAGVRPWQAAALLLIGIPLRVGTHGRSSRRTHGVRIRPRLARHCRAAPGWDSY